MTTYSLFRITLVLILIGYINNEIIAQNYYPNYDFVSQSKEITQQTPDEELKEFLKSCKAKAIEFNSQSSNSRFPIRIKKKNGWALLEAEWKYEESYGEPDSLGFSDVYMVDHLVGYYILEKKRYSLYFLDSTLSQFYNFTIAESNGKKYAAELNDDGIIIHEAWFDDIDPVIDSAKAVMMNPETFEDIYKSIPVSRTMKLKRGDKWALFGYAYSDKDEKSQLLQLTGFQFDLEQEIPSKYYNGFIKAWDHDLAEFRFDVDLALDAKKYFETYPELDHLRPIEKTESGEQLYITHSINSDLWSVLGTPPEHKLSYPKGVSSIIASASDNLFAIREGSKIGFYNSDFTKNLPIEFDEYENVFLDALNGLALRQGDNWQLYDYKSLTKLIDGSSSSIDGLVELWLNR